MAHRTRFVLVALLLAAFVPFAAYAQGKSPSSDGCRPLQFGFPAASPVKHTSWELCFQAVSGKMFDETSGGSGLMIQEARFRRSPTAEPLLLWHDARLAEIFVPYHDGDPRFHDISEFDFDLATLSDADCPAAEGAQVLFDKVCMQVRDRGLAWKIDRRGTQKTRRGEEVVLWSVLKASNYLYVMEWIFRDDGAVVARAGSTGPKLAGADDPVGHAHTFTWRIDFDLNGPEGDSVHKTWHREVSGVGRRLAAHPARRVLEADRPMLVRDESECMSPGKCSDDGKDLVSTEGGLEWIPEEFTTIEIEDHALENGRGRETSYELIPLRNGGGGHLNAYTRSDFWVTRYRPGEMLAENLPTYARREVVTGQDLVVWHTATAHHEDEPRDEDRDTVPILWVSFQLEPHNVFDGTPFFDVTPDTPVP